MASVSSQISGLQTDEVNLGGFINEAAVVSQLTNGS